MKKKYLLFLFLFLFCLYISAENSDETVKFSGKLDNRLSAMLKKAVAEDDTPNALCCVICDGKVKYFKAFGYADREKGILLDKKSIFRIASQTKLITTVGLLKLYEKGYFLLDDPVKKYLPEFSNPVVYYRDKNGVKKIRKAKGDITIRELLSHSSGISYDSGNSGLEVVRYKRQIPLNDAVKRISNIPLRFDPGCGFVYGYSLDVAGRLIEVISGERLDVFLKENVTEPLDMKDTYFYLPEKKYSRLVSVYTRPSINGSVMFADSLDKYYPLTKNPVYFGGGAGMSGTVKDYSNLCRMILNGGKYGRKRILSKKTVEQMCTDQLFGVNGGYKFGLGLEISTKEDFARRLVSPGSLMWGGYYGTHYFMDPKYNLIVLYYTNKVNYKTRKNIWYDVLRIVYQSIE